MYLFLPLIESKPELSLSSEIYKVLSSGQASTFGKIGMGDKSGVDSLVKILNNKLQEKFMAI